MQNDFLTLASCRSEHWCTQGGRGAFFERAFHARDKRGEEQAVIADAPPSFPFYGLFSLVPI
jgi:hypothetical protein